MPRIKEVFLNPFVHPAGGQLVEASAVILQEPGFDNIRVHRAMSHHIMQALLGLEKHKSIFQEQQAEAQTIDAEGNPDESSENILQLFAMAIEDFDKYDAMVSNIQRTMTGNATIARVKGTDAPLTDQTWREIAKTNDIEGVNRVLGAFAGFFLQGPQAPQYQSANGSGALTESVSPLAVESRVQKPSIVRYEN